MIAAEDPAEADNWAAPAPVVGSGGFVVQVVLPGPVSIARRMIEGWVAHGNGSRLTRLCVDGVCRRTGVRACPGEVQDEGDVLAGLDDGQRSAVLAPSGPVCVLAGAGTGKTRTITHRIAHLIGRRRAFVLRGAGGHLHHPGRRRDAGAAAVPGRARACRPGPSTRPRSSSCGTSGRGRSAVSCGRCWSTSCGWSPSPPGGRTPAPTPRPCATWPARSNGRRPPWPARRTTWRRSPNTNGTPRCRPRRSPRCSPVYESVKQEAEQLDFDDLLLHTCAVLEDDEAVAREFRSRYRCFVVDEYQDVTPLQQRTLDAWLGGRDQLTVVGDANQTIYSFAGASPGLPARLRAEVPERRRRPAGTGLPVDPAGGDPGQPDHRRRRRAVRRSTGCGSPRCCRTARRPRSPSIPTNRPRPNRWPRQRRR